LRNAFVTRVVMAATFGGGELRGHARVVVAVVLPPYEGDVSQSSTHCWTMSAKP
jgi:hypothetical protein